MLKVFVAEPQGGKGGRTPPASLLVPLGRPVEQLGRGDIVGGQRGSLGYPEQVDEGDEDEAVERGSGWGKGVVLRAEPVGEKPRPSWRGSEAIDSGYRVPQGSGDEGQRRGASACPRYSRQKSAGGARTRRQAEVKKVLLDGRKKVRGRESWRCPPQKEVQRAGVGRAGRVGKMERSKNRERGGGCGWWISKLRNGVRMLVWGRVGEG